MLEVDVMSTQYVRTQILLDSETRTRLDEIARLEERSLSDLVREMLREQLRLQRQQKMAAAAQVLLHDYQTDEELTAFLALDGEDIHA
jgi:predicted transcriptional regulator